MGSGPALHGPSPLAAPVTVRHRRPGGLDAAFVVDPSEPVLPGHFPGFPIFPGVCLVECAHQACLEAVPAGAGLAAVENARFLAPVFPGDEVLIGVDVSAEPDAWRCTVSLRARRARGAEEIEAALVRLRYRAEEGTDGRR